MTTRLIFLTLFLFSANFALPGCTKTNQDYTDIRINDSKFRAEWARTPSEKEQGLSGRNDMRVDEGMLFSYNNEVPGFWMKNMIFPLDIIWIDENFIILDINDNLNPAGSIPEAVFYPPSPISYVLELRGGTAQAKNIKKGDKVLIENADIRK